MLEEIRAANPVLLTTFDQAIAHLRFQRDDAVSEFKSIAVPRRTQYRALVLDTNRGEIDVSAQDSTHREK